MTRAQFLVADLKHHEDRSHSIRFKNIIFDPTESKTQNHEIHGFQVIGEGIIPPTNTVEHQKAYNKGKKSITKFTHLLNGVAGKLSSEHGYSPFVSVSQTALVGGPPLEGHARDIEGITSFYDTAFHFPTTHTTYVSEHDFSRSTQYLHVSAPTLKETDTLFPSCGATATYDTVEILSGVCLFSAKTLKSCFLGDGKFDIEQLLYAKPTLYEMEYIARASSTIADIAAFLILKSGSSYHGHQRGINLAITLDIPSFHYYYTAAQMLSQDRCTTDEALQWLEAIEIRHDKVAAAFQEAINRRLTARGIVAGRDYQVRTTPKDTLLSSYIFAALQQGQQPCFAYTLKKIWNQHEDEAWADFCRLVPEKEKPQDFRALGYLFHVYQVVRPALLSKRAAHMIFDPATAMGAAAVPLPRKLMISVDDRVERRIYTRAQDLLKKLRRCSADFPAVPTLVELYMCRRIFVDGNIAGGDLYQADPGADHPHLLVPKRRDAQDYPAASYGGATIAPVDIVRFLHGVNAPLTIDCDSEILGLGDLIG
ncbi:hypothetical protein BP6252_06513 [Coleophoma cylindrospora]|uniref:Uncharacterized protein n=1 Tax=Coleophoma cylindrospora TaxID=1849047 RepID=A0A3D8RNJ0_9HELO|nr:hypothetical protein BP6252_06513 [Coleophoma cylindrospora]